MPLVFDDEVSAPPATGRLVFDDEQPEVTPAPARQSPLETGARAFAQAPGQTALSAYAGAARGVDTLAETLGQRLPGPLGPIAKGYIQAATAIPRFLGPIAKDAAIESERVYAPDRSFNPKAATVGSAVGQALPMAASAVVAGPVGPMALGAGQGMDQGLDQAEEMGITDPARKLALGSAYAGIESAVERLGGIGAKGFTGPVKRTMADMLKAGGKTVLSEGAEEPLTGGLQDAAAVAMAPPSYDSTELRPFVMTPIGVPLPNQSYFDRRGLETLGGIAGGAVGAGVQALANRSTPTQAEPPSPTSDPLAAFAATLPEPVAPVGVKPLGDQAPPPTGSAKALTPTPADPAAGSLIFDDGEVWGEMPSNEGPALEGQPIDETPSSSIASVTDPTAQRGPSPPLIGSNGPESAPPDKTGTDAIGAGSNPATGALSEQPGTENPEPGTSTYSGPSFGSGASAGRTRQVPVIPDAPYGGRDVLDFINDNTIAVPRAILDVINQKKGAKLTAQSTGDFNWLEKYEVPKGFRKYLFSESLDQTSDINEVAQDAFEADLISDPTPDALMAKILETIDAREGYTRDVDAREKQLAAEEKALLAREKAEAKRQQSWADDVINGSMETPFIGIDPKLMAAYTVKGAQLIKEGFTTFAKWSREMISRFGEKVREYLEGAWQAAMKNSQAGGSLPNGEKPGTMNREPGTSTPNDIRLTHEAEAERMAAEGQGPLPTGGQFTVEQVTEEAAERVRNGEAPALLRSLETEPRILTPLEHYMLMNYAGALESDIAQSSATLANPSTTPEARQRAAANKAIATEERIKIAVAAQIAGSKAGAALGARSRGLDRAAIPSLAEMVADITLIQDPTGKTPLTPEDRKVIETTHTKMVEAEQALEKQREEGKGGAQETFNTELQRLLDEAKAEIAEHQAIIETQREILKDKGAPVKLYTKSKAKLQEWSDAGDAAMQRLRDKGFFAQANMGVDVSVIGDLAEVLRGWMSKGVLNTASLTAKLMTTMGEQNFMQVKKFLPQIFDKADQLAREGAKKKTPDEILAKGRKAAAANEGKLPRSLARQLALAHIVDHIERKDKTLSAAKIADLVRKDLEEFQPGITTREARDLISGYGQATFPSKDEARAELRNLGAQMQKITQLEALRNKESLLKSGPQRDAPSAELRELQKQVEELKREIGYESRSKEDELKSARDRIKTHLENQIEELQRVLDGKARPANPREAVVYDAELNALKDLRGSLRDLVAEMPEHKLASEARRNKAAMKSAQKSEAEWNRRAKAMQWKRPGKPPAAVSAEVDAARAKAKEARENFEALKKAADPRNDPEAKALRDFKRRTQKSIDDINTKIRTGAYDPPKKTPRQIKHDQETGKLRHDLAMKQREWIDLKLKHRMATMGWGGKGLELVRKLYHLARSLKAGGEFSGVLNQGMIPMVTQPLLTFGSIPKMFKAFVSPQNETAIMDQIWARGNSINGRYKKHRLAINDHMDYSTMQAEGNYRSAWGNKIPFFAGTGRAYTTLLNHMRADLFDHEVSVIEKRKARRGETITERELDAIAEEVNDSTGHGKLGFGKREITGTAKDLLGAFVFSPSFVMSRLRYPWASIVGGSRDTRRLFIENRIRAMAGFAALYALALAMQGDDDDEMNLTEPRDSTWMKPKLSRTYLDLLAGLQQIAVLASRLFTGTTVKGGKEIDLSEPRSGSNYTDVLMNFAKTKRSPAVAIADEFWNRADYFGKPMTRGQAALNAITPITAGSIRDLIENEPPELAIPLSVGAFFGLRTDTRAPKR